MMQRALDFKIDSIYLHQTAQVQVPNSEVGLASD